MIDEHELYGVLALNEERWLRRALESHEVYEGHLEKLLPVALKATWFYCKRLIDVARRLNVLVEPMPLPAHTFTHLSPKPIYVVASSRKTRLRSPGHTDVWTYDTLEPISIAEHVIADVERELSWDVNHGVRNYDETLLYAPYTPIVGSLIKWDENVSTHVAFMTRYGKTTFSPTMRVRRRG